MITQSRVSCINGNPDTPMQLQLLLLLRAYKQYFKGNIGYAREYS